ncbi:rRNA processing/ribosome biogenesis-domain-containing protein [Mycena maculata]|uniref:Pre-rRNA-processing protein RIX1 n=1 Tax=Mycena maculata TaxID=230809 RepID=A0AAD7MK25_9AGAR|nr:rRNA processing/ribosome biogenesis-domain-containing protein [Mycena maculata]
MDPGHPLKALLQLQLGSDSYAVIHLPYILASLTAESLVPSSHSSKWTARINSLLHSKAPDARWAGLCIAHKSSVLSKSMMIECAQSWIGIALPVLSKKESAPIICASLRLLRVIFSAATDVPEFQRQVATPNVSKFTAALIPLAEKHVDVELKILILSTLALIIPLYPTPHRTSHPALSTLCLGFLNGNPFKPPNKVLTSAASRLYAVLHFTGGKVGAANLWRKSVDDTLTFGWTSFLSLRSTFLVDGRLPTTQAGAATEEPLLSIPLNLDRLRLTIVVLCDLLKTTTHRPVQVPLGPLTKFALALLSCTTDDKVDQYIDPGVRAMEAALTPQIWKSACSLIVCLANCVGHHLSSSLTRIVTYITFHLEQHLTSAERLPFLNTLQVILAKCHPLHSTVVVTRLARATLPLISVVLAKQADVRDTENDALGRSKKSKKRAREFEGDEIFKISREVVCSTVEEGNELLAAFSVVRLVLLNPNLSPAMQSISCRVTLSVLLTLPQISPASLSPDLKLHPLVLERVQELSAELGAGSTGGMSKTLGLVVGASLGNTHIYQDLEVLLHPRLPPLVRSLPFVESLSLFRAEESQEEADACESLGLIPSEGKSHTPDIVTVEPPPVPALPLSNKSPAVPVVAQIPVAQIPVTPATSLLARPQQSSQPPPQHSEPGEAPVLSPPPEKSSHEAPAQVDMPMLIEEDEKNEEMPAIDLGSDSDSD